MKDNVKSVIQRAVEMHRASQGKGDFVEDDAPHHLELVVDTSPIRIAELEAQITEIAHNIGTDHENVTPWSKDVGEALVLMDNTLAENERLMAIIGMVKAHLQVATNIPVERDRSGYIDAALEILRVVKKDEVTS